MSVSADGRQLRTGYIWRSPRKARHVWIEQEEEKVPATCLSVCLSVCLSLVIVNHLECRGFVRFSFKTSLVSV